MRLAAGRRIGQYEVKSFLSAGGMGEVYLAFDPRLGRQVALKILPSAGAENPGWVARFEREARAAGALNHPNIVAVYDVGADGGVPYLVAELLDGETLRERIASGPVPLKTALDWAQQIARGLAAAHARGIVHRDLKPANLFVTREGLVKILDFGVAKVVSAGGLGPGLESTLPAEGTQVDDLTASGAVVGTVGYMSPEQVRGQPADARSDIFAFGAVVYELVSGRRAFRADTGPEIAVAILKDEPPPMAPASPELERLARRCLEKRPEDRFQTARDLCFALESLAPSSVVVSRRHTPLVMLVGAVVVAGAIAAAVLLVARARRDTAPSPPSVVPAVTPAQAPPPTPRFTRVTFTEDVGDPFGAFSGFATEQQTFLFTRWRWGKPSVHLGRIGTEESRPLGLDNAVFLDVSTTGELLIKRYDDFVWNEGLPGTLARIALTGGSPRDVARDVIAASWSPDGRNIAAIRRVSGQFALEYPLGTTLYTSPFRMQGAAISPRGDQVALVEHPIPRDTHGSVVVVDLDGSRKQLTRVFVQVCCVVWAPSGRKIYFSAAETGVAQIWEVTLDGRERSLIGTPDHLSLADVAPDGSLLIARVMVKPLIRAHRRGDARERDLSGYVWAHPGDISDDGEWITMVESAEGPEYKIYLRRTDGSAPVLLGEGTDARLSPDGSYVVAGSVASPALIRIIPTGAGPPRELPTHGLTERRQPMWMRDGRRVIYSGVDGRGVRRLHVQEVDGREPPRAFGPEGATLEAFCGSLVSPDGRWVAARDNQGAWMLVALDGVQARAIPTVGKDESIRQWTADGRFLYVAGRRTDPRRIDKLDMTTGRRSRFVDVGGQISNSRGGIVSVFLNPSGTAWVYSTAEGKADLYVVEASLPP